MINIDVFCSVCGSRLDAEFDKKRIGTLRIPPCSICVHTARARGYKKGCDENKSKTAD